MDKKLEKLINTAIDREKEAYDFYTGLLSEITEEATRNTIEFIANEEKKHRDFLEKYRNGRYGPDTLKMSDVVYYKIAEYQESPDVAPDMTSEDVFLVASHRELQSYHFYNELAAAHPSSDVKEVLLKMANEELKHKEKMEYLYSNTAFPQTSGG